jgi:hypothetical protein
MAKKSVGVYVTRPGKHLGDPPITIPVPEDLLSVPGIPTREADVAFFAREDPLENMAVAESASADWARDSAMATRRSCAPSTKRTSTTWSSSSSG